MVGRVLGLWALVGRLRLLPVRDRVFSRHLGPARSVQVRASPVAARAVNGRQWQMGGAAVELTRAGRLLMEARRRAWLVSSAPVNATRRAGRPRP